MVPYWYTSAGVPSTVIADIKLTDSDSATGTAVKFLQVTDRWLLNNLEIIQKRHGLLFAMLIFKIRLDFIVLDLNCKAFNKI